LKPRIEIVHECVPFLATSTPGASRSISGRRVSPERRISSPVMT